MLVFFRVNWLYFIWRTSMTHALTTRKMEFDRYNIQSVLFFFFSWNIYMCGDALITTTYDKTNDYEIRFIGNVLHISNEIFRKCTNLVWFGFVFICQIHKCYQQQMVSVRWILKAIKKNWNAGKNDIFFFQFDCKGWSYKVAQSISKKKIDMLITNWWLILQMNTFTPSRWK